MAHRPRKRFGQNFLHDSAVIADILQTINTQPQQHWAEIGPGIGAITQPLLQQGVAVDAIEIDRDLTAVLAAKLPHPNLTVHNEDALRFDFASLAQDGRKLHLVGNLPYNISTPLLLHLMQFVAVIDEMYFMLQQEVAQRICAAIGGKKYGRLTVLLQYYCKAEYILAVAPASFTPAPKVHSAFIKLTPHQTPCVHCDPARLNQTLTLAFSKRRKTIANALKPLITPSQLSNLGVDPNLRPECISLSQFALLSNM